MKVLVIDVGGTNVKVSATGRRLPIKIPSGPKMTPARMVTAVKKATEGWAYDAVSIGYPGPVRDGRPTHEPVNLGRGWVRFDFAKSFGKPVRIVNDAAMAALGSYEGGRMLFLGLGTGLGSAFVADGQLEPLEMAHLPYRKGLTYEDYLGRRGKRRMGRKKWRRHVRAVADLFKQALQADYVMLGGGNSRKLGRASAGARLCNNASAIAGGIRLWNDVRSVPRRKLALKSAAHLPMDPGNKEDGRMR